MDPLRDDLHFLADLNRSSLGSTDLFGQRSYPPPVCGCGTLQTFYVKSFGCIDHEVGNYLGVISEVNPQLPKYPLFGWCPENRFFWWYWTFCNKLKNGLSEMTSDIEFSADWPPGLMSYCKPWPVLEISRIPLKFWKYNTEDSGHKSSVKMYQTYEGS